LRKQQKLINKLRKKYSSFKQRRTGSCRMK
jgi:hypothetical protein